MKKGIMGRERGRYDVRQRKPAGTSFILMYKPKCNIEARWLMLMLRHILYKRFYGMPLFNLAPRCP